MIPKPTEHNEPAVPGERLSILVDAALPGTPISRYVYGQFIEHLGRCIYGGIWAEMLEDRKFFEPVGEGESPWRPVGASGTVRMDARAPFVGEHTPRVDLPGDGTPAGISQGGLALEAGRDYVGRVWLSGADGVGPVSVSLAWGDGPEARETVTIQPIGPEFTRFPLRFSAGASTTEARLEITAIGSGSLCVGTVSLMPSDNVRGMRSDTLALLKQLDAPLYRWPGGNFVSGYDWRDGIGEADRRAPRKNPAWQGIEHNDFGIHEFLDLCQEIGAEPLIVVNTGFGDAVSAAQEVEYVNGTPDTPMGQWRARDGRREPWDVNWWGVGNEMFGPWQLGYMALEQYIQKHRDVESRMRKVDPSIITIAVGETGPWSEGMMRECADAMDLISEHFYCKSLPDVAEHVAQMPAAIRAKVEAHRRYREEIEPLRGRDIRIAMDEWNYWYGSEPFGELGTRYYLKDALGIAAGLHEYFRNSDMIAMANYAQTVNVIGCIKTTPTTAAFETTGLVLALYRRHFGIHPLTVHGVEAPFDVAAALSDHRAVLTLGVVNPTAQARTLDLDISGVRLSGGGRRWQIAGPDPMAHNDPGDDPRVIIEEAEVKAVEGAHLIDPYSVTLMALDLLG